MSKQVAAPSQPQRSASESKGAGQTFGEQRLSPGGDAARGRAAPILPDDIVNLQRMAGNRAVVQLLADYKTPAASLAPVQGAPAIQRNDKSPENKLLETIGELPAGSRPLFMVSLVVSADGPVRTEGRGHTWIKVRLGPGFHETEELPKEVRDSMSGITRTLLDSEKHETTIGFAARGLQEPDNKAEDEVGAKAFALSDPKRAIRFFTYIEKVRNRTLNVKPESVSKKEMMKLAGFDLWWYNCTTFAVKAMEEAGLGMEANLTVKNLVYSPLVLYKRLYQAQQLGDHSVTIANLGPGERHLTEGQQAKLNARVKKKQAKDAKRAKGFGGAKHSGSFSDPIPLLPVSRAHPTSSGPAPAAYSSAPTPAPAQPLPPGHLVCAAVESPILYPTREALLAKKEGKELASGALFYVPFTHGNVRALREQGTMRGDALVIKAGAYLPDAPFEVHNSGQKGWMSGESLQFKNQSETRAPQSEG